MRDAELTGVDREDRRMDEQQTRPTGADRSARRPGGPAGSRSGEGRLYELRTGEGRLVQYRRPASIMFIPGGSALGLEGPGRSRRGAENGWNFHTARAVEGYAEPRDGSCRCEGPFRRLGNV